MSIVYVNGRKKGREVQVGDELTYGHGDYGQYITVLKVSSDKIFVKPAGYVRMVARDPSEFGTCDGVRLRVVAENNDQLNYRKAVVTRYFEDRPETLWIKIKGIGPRSIVLGGGERKPKLGAEIQVWWFPKGRCWIKK